MRLYIAKAEEAPVGTVHTWTDGKQHQKVAPDKWVEKPEAAPVGTPHALWGTLKPGDYFQVDTYVYKVKQRNEDGTITAAPKGGQKLRQFRLEEAGKVARRDQWGWGHAVYQLHPYAKPASIQEGDLLPPPRPANPHPLFDQTMSLLSKVKDRLKDSKGPKVEKLLAGFVALTHQAAKLVPDDKQAHRVEMNASILKRDLMEYLQQRARTASLGARKEEAAKRTAEEQSIAKPTNTPMEELPRPEPPPEVAQDLKAGALWAHIANRRIVDSYTIGDYPIGRGYRGQLKLWVEHTPGHGWRMVTQTTDREGSWNKPHPGQYSNTRMMVVEPHGTDDRGVVLALGHDGKGARLMQVRGQTVLDTSVGGEAIVGLAKQRWVSDSVAAGTDEELAAKNAERRAAAIESAKKQFLDILGEGKYRYLAVAATADPDRLGSQKRRSYEKSVALLKMWGIDDNGQPKRDVRGNYIGKLGQIQRFLKRHGEALPGTTAPVSTVPKIGAERIAELQQLQDAKPAPKLTQWQKDLGQFMTPHPIAYQMAELGNVKGLTVLDPTAGEGRLLKYAQEMGADLAHGFEVDRKLAAFAGVQHDNFLDVPDGYGKSDVLLMNPPFANPGAPMNLIVDKAIRHHWTGKGPAVLLLPAGRAGDKVIEKYRNLVVQERDLPDEAFKHEGTNVRTRLYVLKLSHRDQLGPVEPSVQKAFPVGTVHTWADGKQHQKVAPDKWAEKPEGKQPVSGGEQLDLLAPRAPRTPALVVAVKPPPEEPPAKPEGGQKYETTGYVFGSRAELWSLRNSGDLEKDPKVAFATVTKKAVMGGEVRPESFLAEKDAGVEPAAAYMKYRLLQSVQSRPPDSPEMRELFSEGIMTLQAGLGRCQTAGDVTALMNEWRLSMDGYGEPDRLTAAEAQALGFTHLAVPRYGDGMTVQQYYALPEYLAHLETEALVKEAGYARTSLKPDGSVVLYRRLSDASSEAMIRRAIAMGRAFVGLLNLKIVNVNARWSSAVPPKWQSRHATGDSHSKLLTEARALQSVPSWDWAQAKAPGPAKPSGPDTSTTRAEKDQYHTILAQSRMGKASRKGPPLSNTGIGAQGVKDALALHEVEYGNWASDDERQWHTEAAHSALHDLADILGIAPTKIGLNRRLGMAIGSRGKGKATAHYEPTTQVINITKMSGKGSLAHEWGHFLDHTLYTSHNPTGGKTLFPSDMVAHGKETPIPTEIKAALKNVLDEIMYEPSTPNTQGNLRVELATLRNAFYQAGDYATRMAYTTAEREERRLAYNAKVKEFNAMARKRDFRVHTPYAQAAAKMGDYWARPHELFARSFEAFVQDELANNDRHNTYLVDGTDYYPKYPGFYTGGEHRKRVHAKMLDLVAVLNRTDQFSKSLRLDSLDWGQWLDGLQKAFPVGTVHTWTDGNLYVKVAPGKWQPAPQGHGPATHGPVSEAAEGWVDPSLPAQARGEMARLRKNYKRLSTETRAGLKRLWVSGHAFGLPKSTAAHHGTATGETSLFGAAKFRYTPERQAMHQQWIHAAVDSVESPLESEGRLVAIVMMGGMAAGKGVIKHKVLGGEFGEIASHVGEVTPVPGGTVGEAIKAAYVNLDPDEVKEMIPEYAVAMHLATMDGKIVTSKDAGLMAHDESSHVVDAMLEYAVAQKKNVIVDGSGRHGNKYLLKIAALQDKGYHVRLVYAHVEKKKAIKRAKQRAQDNGRVVLVNEVLIPAHDTVPKNFKAVAAAADDYAMLYSADWPANPILMQSGPPPQVHDQRRLAAFDKMVDSLGGSWTGTPGVATPKSTRPADSMNTMITAITTGPPTPKEQPIPHFDGRGGVIQVEPEYLAETQEFVEGLPADDIVTGGLPLHGQIE